MSDSNPTTLITRCPCPVWTTPWSFSMFGSERLSIISHLWPNPTAGPAHELFGSAIVSHYKANWSSRRRAREEVRDKRALALWLSAVSSPSDDSVWPGPQALGLDTGPCPSTSSNWSGHFFPETQPAYFTPWPKFPLKPRKCPHSRGLTPNLHNQTLFPGVPRYKETKPR